MGADQGTDEDAYEHHSYSVSDQVWWRWDGIRRGDARLHCRFPGD